jgi:glycosyltransferase involved in cell wall biosynthesis
VSSATWPRVLSVPGRHPYVDRLHGPVARLVGDGGPDGDARALDPAWIRVHALEWDVAHLHLGLGVDPLDLWGAPAPAGSPERTDGPTRTFPADGDAALVAAVQAQRAAGVPVVVTVHGVDRGDDPLGRRTTDLLRHLGPAVAAVLTLTRGCADHLEAAIGRPVRVVPHGPLLDAATRTRLRAHRRRLVTDEQPVLLHAGSLPDDLPWQDVLDAARRAPDGHRIRVLVRADLAPAVARAAVDVPTVSVEGHRWMGRDVLARAIASAGALLLPDLRGCHSAVLELAADVGTPVAAADVGWRCQQQPAIPLPVVAGRLDVDALGAVLDGPLPTRDPVREVERERDDHAFRTHHQRLYHRLLVGRAADDPDVSLVLPDVAAGPTPPAATASR